MGAILALGFVLRIILSRLGHNYDLESYWIVGEIVVRGGNVYAETHRYNYGPIWFYILGLVYWITDILGRGFGFFGLLIAVLLSVVDVGIFYILYKKFGLITASIFFLNPVSIIITGYHRQFDNLAILIALYAIYLLDLGDYNFRKVLFIAFLIGLSITVKHVFFMLPVWLFFAHAIKDLKVKLMILVIPLTVFFVSFVPFWQLGSEGIIQNVFLYKSFNNSPFWYIFAPGPLYDLLASKKVFIGILVICGFLLRKLNVFQLALIYTIFLVVFSPAIANQYLAIPLAAMAVYPNIFFFMYSYLTTVLLLKDKAALGITPMGQYTELLPFDNLIIHTSIRAYDLIIVTGLGGLVMLLRQICKSRFHKLKSVVYYLLGTVKLWEKHANFLSLYLHTMKKKR